MKRGLWDTSADPTWWNCQLVTDCYSEGAFKVKKVSQDMGEARSLQSEVTHEIHESVCAFELRSVYEK